MNRIRLRLYNISNDVIYRYIVLGYFVRRIVILYIRFFFFILLLILYREEIEVRLNEIKIAN